MKKNRPGNLSEFKLLTFAALQLVVPIRFQNASFFFFFPMKILHVIIIHVIVVEFQLFHKYITVYNEYTASTWNDRRTPADLLQLLQ